MPYLYQDPRWQMWSMGSIAQWYLRPSQLEIYLMLRSQKRPHIECARQFGKTTSILVWVLEELNRHPGHIVRWCEPLKNQCREIVIPEVKKLQKHAPYHMRMKWNSTDSVFRHPNGSLLYLRGVNEDSGESARGSHANIIVADEFGFWKNAKYIVEEVLKPQLETTGGSFVYTSTPPEDLSHLYYQYADEAVSDGRFLMKTIYDNESLSPERIEEIKKDCGGDNSIAWLRERLCHRIKDPEKVIVPEYEESRVMVPNDYPKPRYFDAYVGGDSGADDNTAILYAYIDFVKGEVVFEDELVMNNATTPTIIAGSKEKERINWGTAECQCQLGDFNVGPKMCLHHGLQPMRRVYDADKQLIYDIAREHKYLIEYPEKTEKLASIRWFRRMVQDGKVKVKERCKVLHRQLRVGQWSNEKHTDFMRSDDADLKHLDALAAAIYLVRSVLWTHNPFPQYEGVSPYTHFIPETPTSTHDEQALDAALGGF